MTTSNISNIEEGLAHDTLSVRSREPVASANRLRLFRIHRTKDGKGISGVGKVIDGVLFENGQVVVCWKSQYSSLGIFRSMDDFVQVHAKPFFKENEFEWVNGYSPDQELNDALDEAIDFVLRQTTGIRDKTKGNIVSKLMAMKRHNQKAVDPIRFNKRSGERLTSQGASPEDLNQGGEADGHPTKPRHHPSPSPPRH